MEYKNKNIAVLGMGESGVAAALLLAQEGAQVTVLDSASFSRLEARIAALKLQRIATVTGDEAELDPRSYDRVVLSPGIDPATPLVQAFLRKRIDMIGELELAYEVCACPIVAITGTNGKTTTTELIASLLNSCGVRTVACGNIGPAFAAKVKQSVDLQAITVEVSSFQLEQIRRFRARVAVWLNLTPDHLDRYASTSEYRAAKLRIFENQTSEDFAIVNYRDELPPLKARKITFSAYVKGGDFEFAEGMIHYHGKPVLRMNDTNLRGLHNAENLMAALGAGIAQGLSFEAMAPALCAYRALPHRCEVVRTLRGVEYVNDSKATNLDALEKALESQTRPVVLIAGGKDKGFEFDTITALVASKARAAVLIGEMAPRIESLWADAIPCMNRQTLEEAVQAASSLAQPGDVVLLSPGTSSFDMFKNYAERGNLFREIVNALK